MNPAVWMDIPSLADQPIWMFFGQRAKGTVGYPPAHHWRRCLSTCVHQVQTCCHILQLYFALCSDSQSFLTAGACVISVCYFK